MNGGSVILYVSGPMTGHPEWNFPAFGKASKVLRSAGFHVVSPAENWAGATDVPREVCMKLDLHQVLASDGVAVLPGWEDSHGAVTEVRVAQEIGLRVMTVDEWVQHAASDLLCRALI
jgi:hypothetical protein